MINPLTEDKFASWVWTRLLEHYPATIGLKRRVWNKLYELADQRYAGRPVSVQVHGAQTLLNYGHAYPLFSRKFKSWNLPLIELVYQAAKAAGRPVSYVDVGSGVGDTIRLLSANCTGMLSDVHAVEGDAEFFAYLDRNVPASAKHFRYNVMLSAEPGEIASLVHHHTGTAAAHGDALVPCTTLDMVLIGRQAHIDILKIDVDGYDGQVLAGSRSILATDKPYVIFEWHPLLYEKSAQSWTQPFEVLTSSGYSEFAWFNKYGHFSHFTVGLATQHTQLMAQLCLGGKHDVDWHYDIVALPRDSVVRPVPLAELSYAKRRPSPF